MLSLYLSMVDSEDHKTLVEMLYYNCEQIMYRTAFGVLHNEQDAEDAVHEAFVRIISRIERIEAVEPAKRKSYAVIVTRNIAVDMYRRNKKQLLMEELPENADKDSDVEREVFGRYDRDTLYEALKTLPAEQRELLIMYYFHNAAAEDISEVLGISTGTVKVRLFRARKALYGRLKDGDDNDL